MSSDDQAEVRLMKLSLSEATYVYPIVKFFNYDHLPEKLQQVSKPFADLALVMCRAPRNAETSAGLRKLLEAKDCAVRAALP